MIHEKFSVFLEKQNRKLRSLGIYTALVLLIFSLLVPTMDKMKGNVAETKQTAAVEAGIAESSAALVAAGAIEGSGAPVTEISEAAGIPNAAEIPEAAGIPNAAEIPEAAEILNAAGIPEAVEILNAAGISEAAKAAEVSATSETSGGSAAETKQKTVSETAIKPKELPIDESAAFVSPVKVSVADIAKIIWPVEGKIIREFGLTYSLTYSDYRNHNGVDIEVKRNTEALAVMPGKVVGKTTSRAAASTIVIDHGSGWQSEYGHLEESWLKQGDSVKSGQIVGLIGQPGVNEILEGPHLHFVLYKDGHAVDPLEYLP